MTRLNKGPWQKAVDRANALMKKGELRQSENKEFVLYKDNYMVILANPQASHGYLYVAAFPRPLVSEYADKPGFNLHGEARYTGEDRKMGPFTHPMAEIAGVQGAWSNREILPKIGQRVYGAVNNLGWGTVVAYFTEAGFLGVEIALEEPPKWFLSQHEKDGHFNALMFGCDLHPDKK